MKHLFILCFACVSTVLVTQNLAAQGKNIQYGDAEKKDTTIYAIWGSQTHSGSECGHNRSSKGRPSFRIMITDFEIDKPGATEVATPVSYQAQVNVQTKGLYPKTKNFKFQKVGKGKKGSVWAIDVPCSTDEATVTIDLRQKKNGKIKPLNLNSKGNKNQLKLSVDFTEQKVYSLEGGKSLMGNFNKKLTASGRKMGNADKGSLKITVE